MLLQSVSDGQIRHDGDAEPAKMVGRTYARAHENGGASECAGGQDDEISPILIARCVNDPDSAIAIEHAVNFHPAFDREV